MFVAINLIPKGSMTSRADLLGYTDDQIGEINANRESATIPAPLAQRINEVNDALRVAAVALWNRDAYGSVQ